MYLELRVGSFFRAFSLLLACAAVLLLTYTGQIGEANAYLGMKPWDMSLAGYVGFAVGFPIVVAVLACTKGRPSDFFRLFYGSIAVISFLVLHPVLGPTPAATIFIGLVLLFLPLLMFEVLDFLIPPFKLKGIIASTWVESLVVLALVVVMLSAFANPPASAGFGFDLSYDRRLEGREIYAAGSWLAYGLSMAMNGFAPYLAFRAGLRSHVLLLGMAMVANVFFFWLLGVKAPLLTVVLAAVLGVLVRKGRIYNFSHYFLSSVLVLGLVVLTEWVLFDGYSFVADYFFRRLFAVQAEVQVYYLHFFLGEKNVSWSWLFGTFDRDFSPTYYIGKYYLGNVDSNVNTNAFFDSFAAKGIFGYTFAIFFVPLVFVIFDRMYRSSCNPSYQFLGFLYGLLVVEQAYTVAIISSGVGVLFLLTLLERNSLLRNAMIAPDFIGKKLL